MMEITNWARPESGNCSRYAEASATGLVAIYILWRFYNHYRESSTLADVFYMVSFGVLLVAGSLLIAFTYDVLNNPFVVLVSYLIPAGLSLGLITQFCPKYGMPYLIFVIVVLALIGITRMLELDDLGKIVLPIFHTAAGMIIFLLPMVAVIEGHAPTGILWVRVGGALIGLGGIALAFTWGLMKEMKTEEEALPTAG